MSSSDTAVVFVQTANEEEKDIEILRYPITKCNATINNPTRTTTGKPVEFAYKNQWILSWWSKRSLPTQQL